MKFSDFSDITHGSILSRISDPLCQESNKRVMITLQDLSFYLGHSIGKPEVTFQYVSSDSIDKCIFGRRNNILLGLTTNKAMIIDESLDGALVPSNFALISVDEKRVYPPFMVWYINESIEYMKQSAIINQGTSVTSLSIKELRDTICNLPNYRYQKTIGSLYQLVLKNEKLERERKELLLDLIKNKNDMKGNK